MSRNSGLQAAGQDRKTRIEALEKEFGIECPKDLLERLDELLKQKPFDATRFEKLLNYAELVLVGGKNNPVIENYQGLCLVEQGLLQEALTYFKHSSLSQEKKNLSLANIYHKLGDYQRAIICYKLALKSDSDLAEGIHERLCDVYAQEKNYPLSIQHGEAGLKLNPNNIAILEQLIAAYNFNGQHAEIVKIVNESPQMITRIKREDYLKLILESVQQRINHHYVNGEYTKALALVEEANIHFPDKKTEWYEARAAILNYKGYKLFKLYSYSDALEAFDQAYQFCPIVNVFLNRIAAYYALNAFDEAQAYATKVFEKFIKEGEGQAVIPVIESSFSFPMLSTAGQELLEEIEAIPQQDAVILEPEKLNQLFGQKPKKESIASDISVPSSQFSSAPAPAPTRTRTPNILPEPKVQTKKQVPDLFTKNGEVYQQGSFSKMWGKFISKDNSNLVAVLKGSAILEVSEPVSQAAFKEAFDSGRICLKEKQPGMKYVGHKEKKEADTDNWEIKIRENKSRIFGRTLPEKGRYVDENGEEKWVTVIQFDRYSPKGLH